MCRIAGIFDPTNPHLQEDILKMRDAMHRGGPDDAGVYLEGNLAFGHRRLSIIDLSADGHQPMLSDDEQLVICYNGEIYNFQEIKEELKQLGHSFRSQTDTEVILKGYQQMGTDIFAKLNGMFALALYDKTKGELILARDHAGIKPLYYYFEEGKLYFASEIRAFKALNRFEENPDWRIYLLAFGYLPEPITTLLNVQPLPKGSYLRIALSPKEARSKNQEPRNLVDIDLEANTNSSLVSFSTFHFENKITTKEEALSKVKSTLEAAVQRHLISDAPIGLFLSGGIDSSLLTILAQPHLKDKLRTLSIYFDDEKYSEKQYQDIIIQQTGANHQSFKVTQEDFKAALPDALEAMDQPTTDGINTYFICKYAKQAGLTAVLSGLGADELFGGYNSFTNQKRIEMLQHFLPNIAFKTAQLANIDKYQKIAFLSIPGPVGQYLFHRGLLCPKEISFLLDVPESKVWELLTELNYYYEREFERGSLEAWELGETNSSEHGSVEAWEQGSVHKDRDNELQNEIGELQNDEITKTDSTTHTPASPPPRLPAPSHPRSPAPQPPSLFPNNAYEKLSGFNKASALEQHFYMQNQLLKDSDFMSMWHSIEIRVPFLDKELMQLAYSISLEVKDTNRQKKYLLINAFNSLPRAIWDRRKMGFTFPLQKWLQKNQESSRPDQTAVRAGDKSQVERATNYFEGKFEAGNYSWSRFWATKLIN